ncbi:MAG TPA: TolC family protein [Flavipsychrobacter sp.]|nr:TolC family protein [Flavipsychrobacter sp.]
MEDAIARALEHNFDIRVADVVAQQAAVNNAAGNAGLFPNLSGTAGMNTGSANTRIEFADGRIQEVNNAQTLSYNAGVVANYTVFAAGRAWLIRKQLRANEQLAQVQVREQMHRQVSQVIQTYARAVWQQQQSIAIDTGLALAQVRMMLSRVKFETGSSAKFDFLQARVDYNARQSDSLAQVAALNTAFADLNLLMGQDPYKTYDLDDTLEVNIALVPSDPDRLRSTNPTIDIARRNVEIADLDRRISRTFLLPSLDLNAGYNYNRSQSQAGFALFNRTFGPTGGVGLNVPIFQGGNLRRQVKVAALEKLRQDILFARQNTEIARQYRSAWKDYEMSVASYRLEEENINYAKENVDIQKARFRVGIATTLETREAENSYVQALIRLYTAAYNLKVNETRVLELESRLVK